jgi:hypothetical protein
MTARGIGRLDHACQTGRHSQAARGLAVYDGTEFRGFLIVCGANRYEAFNFRGRPLGTFPDQQQASRAIPRRTKESGR